jgi:hypothetical protein
VLNAPANSKAVLSRLDATERFCSLRFSLGLIFDQTSAESTFGPFLQKMPWNNLISALLHQFVERVKLYFCMLVAGLHARVNNRAFSGTSFSLNLVFGR